MGSLQAKYLHRKCRECGEWTTFQIADKHPTACIRCGRAYGRLEVGLDYTDAHYAGPDGKVSPIRASE